MTFHQLCTSACSLAAFVCLLASTATAEDKTADAGAGMAAAAGTFLESLSDELSEAAAFSYDDPERLNWHFIPRERKGVSYLELEGDARAAADQLVRSGLSAAGFRKVLEVRSLEEVLYLFEGGDEAERRLKRHPHKYYLSVFGKPGPQGLWGWRIEGHHLSLNYSVKDGRVVSSTPEFFGANPGLIDAGPSRRLRVLGRREDLARQILKACPAELKQEMWLSREAPNDIRGGGAAQPVVDQAKGVSYAQMTPDQQQLLRELISEYLAAMPASVVRERMAGINAKGMDAVRFAWWGGSELNEPHHYVVQGPTFIIEYNNTQNEANHVHSIWRNLAGDFNVSP